MIEEVLLLSVTKLETAFPSRTTLAKMITSYNLFVREKINSDKYLLLNTPFEIMKLADESNNILFITILIIY